MFRYGMEIEFNDEKRDCPKTSFIWASNRESDCIYEYVVNHGTLNTMIRRLCFVGKWMDVDGGWHHYPGEYDDASESCHLHITYNDCYISNGWKMWLLFADHFSRDGTWRDAVNPSLSTTSYVRQCPQSRLPYDSKETWITQNEIGTLELRINANPFPIVLMLIAPAIMHFDEWVDEAVICTTPEKTVKQFKYVSRKRRKYTRYALEYWMEQDDVQYKKAIEWSLTNIDEQPYTHWVYWDGYLTKHSKLYCSFIEYYL